jgi:hypothetical protein
LALAGAALVLLLVSARQTTAPLRSRLGRSVAPAL